MRSCRSNKIYNKYFLNNHNVIKYMNKKSSKLFYKRNILEKRKITTFP